MINSANISLNNDIKVITLKDNLFHTYFSEITWEHDNSDPVGYAQLKMPYSEEILAYWDRYNDVVIIHGQLKPIEDKTEKKYNHSFIGHIHRVKQVGKTIVLKITDLGWKFMQKVPQDFRTNYIAGQTLDKAFQAICEFMGVTFAYSIEDLQQYSFAADGYSIEKNGEILEEVDYYINQVSGGTDEDLANSLQEVGNENGALPDLHNEQASGSSVNQQTSQPLNSSVNNQSSNQESNQETTDENTEALQKEFDEKIKDLIKGNAFYKDSNIIDAILNYGSITVEPSAPATDTSSNGDITSTDDTSGQTGTDSNTNNNTSSSSSSNTYSNTTSASGNSNKPKVLSKAYINRISPEHARTLRTQNYNTGKYTDDTMQKLLWRSLGITLK